MFEKLKKDADAIRAKEKQVLEDYKQGLTINDIRKKNNVSSKFIKLTIKYYGFKL